MKERTKMRLKNRVEELEKSLERLRDLNLMQNEHYDYDMEFFDKEIESLNKKIEKQEETIKDLMELCEPLLEERLAKSLGKVNDILESALKDLFSSEPASKCKKSAKSSAKKCKKCVESVKTTKKTNKKGEK